MGFVAIGLVVAAVGWYQLQSAVPVAIGFIMQLCGCIFHEICTALNPHEALSHASPAAPAQATQHPWGASQREGSQSQPSAITLAIAIRAKFYRLAVWLLLPVPVAAACGQLLRLWPRPMPSLLGMGITLAACLVLALAATLLLSRVAKK